VLLLEPVSFIQIIETYLVTFCNSFMNTSFFFDKKWVYSALTGEIICMLLKDITLVSQLLTDG
jgi:hypothetical protein